MTAILDFCLKAVPWWGRIAALLALCTALIGFGWAKGAAHESAKFDAYKLSEAQQNAQILRGTIAQQTAMQLKKDEALNAAAKREKKLRADAVSLRADVDGLSSDLAASRALLSSASIGSLRGRVAALEDVFGSCVGKYSELAGHADKASIERDTLIQSWPK